MKNLMSLVIAIICMFAFVSKTEAKIPVLYSSGRDVCKVMDLPIRDEFTIQADNGKWYHADLGILHEQFSIFMIPLFNYGKEKYVLYTDTKVSGYDYTYADLTKSDISYLQSQFAGIPTKPELPFWDAWGGKILAVFLILLYIVIKNN